MSNAIATAREKGASIVVVGTVATGYNQKEQLVPITSINTAYHNGNIYSGYGYANYSGTSTYTTTNYTTRHYSVTVFYQEAYFLAKKKESKK